MKLRYFKYWYRLWCTGRFTKFLRRCSHWIFLPLLCLWLSCKQQLLMHHDWLHIVTDYTGNKPQCKQDLWNGIPLTASPPTRASSWHFELLTFHCKVSELLLLCASLGGKGHSGAQLWVVKLTGSEQDPLTELYTAYTLQRKQVGRMSISSWDPRSSFSSLPRGISTAEQKSFRRRALCSRPHLAGQSLQGQPPQQACCSGSPTQPHPNRGNSTDWKRAFYIERGASPSQWPPCKHSKSQQAWLGCLEKGVRYTS